MAKKYMVKVNDNYAYSISTDSVKNLDIIPNSNNKFHILDKNTSYDIEVVHLDFQNKSYQVKVNGNLYSTTIDNELDLLIQKMGLTINGKQKDSILNAPMPGLIVDIQVKEGDEVEEGAVLLVLEAMKMENMMLAPKAGVVKTIHVTKGKIVEKGQILIEME